VDYICSQKPTYFIYFQQLTVSFIFHFGGLGNSFVFNFRIMNRKTFSLLFFVKRTKRLSHGEVPVYLRITVNSKRTEFSIKRSIKESNWDPKRTKAKGSGKSAIANIFESLHVPVFYADQAGSKVLDFDPMVKNEVVKLLGDEAFLNGKANRQ
jgi:hypothetical protein